MQSKIKSILTRSVIIASGMTLSGVIAAATWIVDPAYPETADFATLPAAIEAAADGDTIKLAPGNYDSLTLSKRIHLSGTGYLLGESYPNVPDLAQATLSHLTFNPGSDGSSVIGLSITSGITLEGGVSNLTFQRNLIGASAVTDTKNTTSESIRAHGSGEGHVFEGIIISQNYIYGSIASRGIPTGEFRQARIHNNIMQGARFWLGSGESPSSEWKHNFIRGGDLIVENATVSGNIIFAESESPLPAQNSAFLNNLIRASGFDDYVDNASVDTGNVSFEQLSDVMAGGDHFELRWALPAGHPGTDQNSDTIDVGPFAGLEPYVQSGIPPGPFIYHLEAPVTGSASSGLPIRIKIKANP
jgi:hypothetical protein